MAAKDTKDILLEQLAGASPQNVANYNNVANNGGVEDDNTDYYKELQNESYKTLLDREIQAQISKERALKYSQQALDRNGFANQGLAESSRLGIQNTLQQALTDAQNQYSNELMNIKQAQREKQLADSNDNFESMSTLLNSAYNMGSLEQLENVYNQYINNPNLSEKDRTQFELLHSMFKEDLENNQVVNANANFDFNAANIYYYDNKGQQKTIANGKDLAQEMATMNIALGNNKFEDGDYIHLKSKEDKNVYLQYVKGVLKYVSKADYEANANNDNSYYIYGREDMKKGKN